MIRMVWTKQQRFEAQLVGEVTDRPSISAWKHILEAEQDALKLAQATVHFAQKYDWDWLKLNPKATYLAEAWGNTYDFADYNWVFPKETSRRIYQPQDIEHIQSLSIDENKSFQEQLQFIRAVHEALPEVPKLQTVFSPLTVLLFLAGRGFYINHTIHGSKQPITLQQLFTDYKFLAHQALQAIAETVAEYAQATIDAGAAGLFYATTGTAHYQLFSKDQFEEFSTKYDFIILDAIRDSQTILHTCGEYADPTRFNDYPIKGISWDTLAKGNPSLSETFNHTKVGGVDHQLFKQGNEQLIYEQTVAALNTMTDQPFLLAPNCAVPPDASEESLLAFKRALAEKY